jgi:hypothetical protein
MAKAHGKRRLKKAISQYQTHILVLGLLCVVTSFGLGIRTAGDVQTISPTNAADTVLAGDMNIDGVLTVEDAISILEIAQGYTDPTPEQLLRDPNEDGQLTVDDAVRVLHDLAAL